jgi:hypothetical protein
MVSVSHQKAPLYEGQPTFTVEWESVLYPPARRLAHFHTRRAAELFAQRLRYDIRQAAAGKLTPEGRSRLRSGTRHRRR